MLERPQEREQNDLSHVGESTVFLGHIWIEASLTVLDGKDTAIGDPVRRHKAQKCKQSDKLVLNLLPIPRLSRYVVGSHHEVDVRCYLLQLKEPADSDYDRIQRSRLHLDHILVFTIKESHFLFGGRISKAPHDLAWTANPLHLLFIEYICKLLDLLLIRLKLEHESFERIKLHCIGRMLLHMSLKLGAVNHVKHIFGF